MCVTVTNVKIVQCTIYFYIYSIYIYYYIYVYFVEIHELKTELGVFETGVPLILGHSV